MPEAVKVIDLVCKLAAATPNKLRTRSGSGTTSKNGNVDAVIGNAVKVVIDAPIGDVVIPPRTKVTIFRDPTRRYGKLDTIASLVLPDGSAIRVDGRQVARYRPKPGATFGARGPVKLSTRE